MSQKFSAVKGMNDLLPGEIERWQQVEAAARGVMGRYGFAEVRTPILEDTALFVRSVGEETDIVGKEMYTFEDKGGRSVSLRPEGTAPAARAYIEHAIFMKEPVTRWFYIGPMFRYERMKTGRYRQFWQVGVEVYGVREPAQDAEVIEMAMYFFSSIGLPRVKLHLNSLGDDACRPAYVEKLVAHLLAHKAELCPDCQSRLERNPLRVLDCKNESCRAITATAPSMLESLCEPCRAHFDEVQRLLGLLDVSYALAPRMVRGLDYYTRTAFEFIADSPALGTATAVGGGGRYDKLVKSLGGPDVPAVGFALGLERLTLLLAETGQKVSRRPELFIAFTDKASQDRALKLAQTMRHQGLWVELDERGGSLKSQMKRADKSGAQWVVVLGERELSTNEAELKPMAGGQVRRVRLDELASALRSA